MRTLSSLPDLHYASRKSLAGGDDATSSYYVGGAAGGGGGDEALPGQKELEAERELLFELTQQACKRAALTAGGGGDGGGGDGIGGGRTADGTGDIDGVIVGGGADEGAAARRQ